MARVKRGVTAHAKHKKILKATKGYRHGRKSVFRQAKQAVLQAAENRYRDSRNKKRVARRGWITTLNAALKKHDIAYNKFINKLNKSDIKLDRKVLADLAVNHPAEFDRVVLLVK